MAIEVSSEDVSNAETFLVAYLSDRVSEADFTPGSAVRDLCVSAVAYAFAFLRSELAAVRQNQSLLRLRERAAQLAEAGTVDPDVDEAVDAILSNYFITRKEAQAASVQATIIISSSVTDLIQLPAETTTFTAPNGLSFSLKQDLSVSIADRYTTQDANGNTVQAYDTVLVSNTPGALQGVVPGQRLSVNTINSGVLYGLTRSYVIGGKSQETTAELLERAPLALATRNLVNSKAISSTLLENFSGVSRVQVIGSGDPEMGRDEVSLLSGTFNLRMGGMVDVYAQTALTRETMTLTIGAPVSRPDGAVLTLRDSSADFSNVNPGDVVNIRSAFQVPGVSTYVIQSVNNAAKEITVEAHTPFPEATDERAAFIDYSVGNTAPEYDNVLATRATGETSRKITIPNGTVLPTGPLYQIQLKRGAAGTAQTTLARQNLISGSNSYTVYSDVPAQGQSYSAVNTLTLSNYTAGDVITMSYDTVEGVDQVNHFLMDPAQRTVGVNFLAKAYHPVYVSFETSYVVRTGAVDPGVAVIETWLRDYVNNYVGDFRLGRIDADLQAAFPALDDVVPTAITMTLLAPDGQVFSYQSTDRLHVVPTLTNGVTFTGAAALRPVMLYGTQVNLSATLADCAVSPVSDTQKALRVAADARLSDYLAYIGVSNRTVRMLAADTLPVVKV